MKANKSFLAIIFIIVLSYSCSEHTEKKVNEHESIPIDSAIVNKKNYDSVFKRWLKDTLVTLPSWQNKLENGIEKKNFSIELDSLTLTVDAYYKSDVNAKSHIEISNMLDLLKEYDELPKKGSISFHYEQSYFPSSVEQLKYEYSYEIDDILVELSQFKSVEYNFIRGRLNHKEIVTTDKSGKEEREQYDFIWDGDKLIKKKLD